jgi:hypothetical protein
VDKFLLLAALTGALVPAATAAGAVSGCLSLR